ncbi:MAG: 3-dehydro-scyllo-inosose hydrolase [Candidatus Hodarchaeota archaeon]
MGNWEIPPKETGHMDKPSGIYLQTMSMKEIYERLDKNDIIIIPVGSTENHGPAACIGEDTFLVTRMAEQIAKKTGCTVAEPIWYGSHPYHHMGLPGTIIVPEDHFKGQLRAVMAGLWNMGFRKQILLNGHGQEYVIPSAIHEFAKRFQVPGIFINLNWYHAIYEHVRDKKTAEKFGVPSTGQFETPFIHADECETSFSMALFPEMVKIEHAEDTTPRGYFSEEHVDKAGNAYMRPIKWYGQVGMGPVEFAAYPEGCVGAQTKSDPKKAEGGINALLDYLEHLIDDIKEKFPPGELPPIDEMTQKEKSLIEKVIKGPLKGGAHIYTIAYPP